MDTIKLGVLAIMKNEAMNVREWLDHYLWLGVDRVFLIDNGSDDNAIEIVDAHPQRARIDLIVRPERHQQGQHYRSAFDLLKIKEQVDWLIMADLDEFWFRKDGGSFKDVIAKQYQHVDLVYTNWTMFGSDELDQHPASLRHALTKRRAKLSSHESSKWLCRTSALTSSQIYTHKIRDVDSRRVASDNVELQLNHYVTQSREYFAKVKMTRGDASNPKSDNVRDWAYFDRHDAACDVEDTTLRDLLPR